MALDEKALEAAVAAYKSDAPAYICSPESVAKAIDAYEAARVHGGGLEAAFAAMDAPSLPTRYEVMEALGEAFEHYPHNVTAAADVIESLLRQHATAPGAPVFEVPEEVEIAMWFARRRGRSKWIKVDHQAAMWTRAYLLAHRQPPQPAESESARTAAAVAPGEVTRVEELARAIYLSPKPKWEECSDITKNAYREQAGAALAFMARQPLATSADIADKLSDLYFANSRADEEGDPFAAQSVYVLALITTREAALRQEIERIGQEINAREDRWMAACDERDQLKRELEVAQANLERKETGSKHWNSRFHEEYQRAQTLETERDTALARAEAAERALERVSKVAMNATDAEANAAANPYTGTAFVLLGWIKRIQAALSSQPQPEAQGRCTAQDHRRELEPFHRGDTAGPVVCSRCDARLTVELPESQPQPEAPDDLCAQIDAVADKVMAKLKAEKRPEAKHDPEDPNTDMAAQMDMLADKARKKLADGTAALEAATKRDLEANGVVLGPTWENAGPLDHLRPNDRHAQRLVEPGSTSLPERLCAEHTPIVKDPRFDELVKRLDRQEAAIRELCSFKNAEGKRMDLALAKLEGP